MDTTGSSSAAAVAPRRVLVVDDNVDTARSFAMLLGMDGHEVRVAYDGPAALEAVRDCVPDVVLLDVGLPGMDGFEVARRLRDSLGQQRPVLIAVTGWGEEEFQLKCTDAMFDHWLVKPVKSDALCKIIRESTAGNIPS